MSNEIVIGITKALSNDLETMFHGMQYTKDVTHKADYISFEYDSWTDPEDNWVNALMTYLISAVGMNNYGFIRLGEEIDDTEIHGNLEAFDIKFNREVSY